MKKTKDITISISIIIVVTFITLGIVLNNPISYNDETILFGEILKMNNGLAIYKDVNILVTPIFFYIGLLFFKVFSANLLTYRIFITVVFVFLYYSIYILFKKSKIKNTYSFISILLLVPFLKELIEVNYNILAIAFSILAISKIINNENKNHKFYLIQGLFLFIIFMTKQNIGVYHFIAFAICEFVLEKKSIKIKLKNMIIYILPLIFGSIIYCLYLYMVNSLYAFIDQVFLGLIDFKQNASIESYIIFLALLNIIPVVYLIIKNKADKNQKILFIYSITMLLITYPILCGLHSKVALVYSLLSLTYCINYNIKKSNEILNYGTVFILTIYLFISSLLGIINWKKTSIQDHNNPYYGAIYDSKINNSIDYMCEYIKNSSKKVIIVSPKSSIFNIPLGINNGILDLPLKGNVGINGSEKIIQEINKQKNVKFVIIKRPCAQEYKEVHEYIKQNYKKTDTIMGIFEVYE